MTRLVPILPLLVPLASCAALERGRDLPVHPQRPTFSNDALTAASGTVELETGVSWDPKDRLGTPVSARLGLDSRSELVLGIEPVVLVGGGAGKGIGDLVVGYRQRLREAEGNTPALAWQAQLKAPTADEDEGLGTGETDLFGAFAATWPDAEYSMNAFLQVGVLGDPGGGSVWQTAGSFGVGTELEADTTGFAEVVVSLTPELDDEQLYGLLGVQVAQSAGRILDLGVLIGLSEDAPDFQLFLGTTTNLGRLAK
jgi:hypothetical protein